MDTTTMSRERRTSTTETPEQTGSRNSHASNDRPVIKDGMTFGRLTAIRSVGRDPEGRGDLWEFICSCDGRIVTFVAATVLRRKGARGSCGCLNRELGTTKRVPFYVAFLRHIDLENRPVPDPKRCNGFGRCLLWNGAGDANGRAQMMIKGNSKRASHVAWFLYHGRWPEGGRWLCHACDNPECVNPLHLFEGDAGANGHDRAAKNHGGILQACSPPDPLCDEKNEAELNRFLQSLRSVADDWQKSKAV
jgi:hypothetical protein